MPRFFLGNFDFEHRLADPTRQLPAKLERINAELATSWLAIADDGDYLWTPQPIEVSFFEQAVRDGLPCVIPVVSFDEVPRGVECITWGWTDDVRRLCDKHGWIHNAPPQEAVRAANSRRFSAALEREWCCGLDFAGGARKKYSFSASHRPAIEYSVLIRLRGEALAKFTRLGRMNIIRTLGDLMKITLFAAFLSGFFLAGVSSADEEVALEKRIEKKVISQHQAEMKKAAVAHKAKLDIKADKHSNSAKAKTHANGKPKVPPKKPPLPPKPKPPVHH